ncbi:carboxylating nicotinate-nucleotide diphosphorylase [Parvibaculum sedimenti]|uniref:Probable nicotinate-nucleotide pyrophosphorylase [carboxylating] n=1 Tax=Parvibaculum sedimenti TaxID=2608632 RepID=A0A6N6VKM4_9HYPH|nr:carboxylating nicotinate-nucleotide diphosphorylase [Parvibaculum sedimenti]KAB7739915.1 carboxylating nicotinate-nucleotide diphosphorylase [Parvibaculum sedimenti]
MTALELEPLPSMLIEPAVKAALLEDLGRAGDITTNATIPASAKARVVIRAREDGRIAGLDCARTAFRLMDSSLKVAVQKPDGSDVMPGDIVCAIEGSARAIITGERVALNFMGHLSGIATATRAIARAIEGTKARICCTRKTTPGLRALEKYAVRAGGGQNHRFGLDDAVLIKDNHIAVAGGITAAIERARAHVGHMVKIEVEVDTLDQLREALAARAELVLLDNMSPAQLREAVDLVAGRAITEASGRVTVETAPAIAAAGVDLISSGAITHSAKTLDLGLDFDSLRA